MSTQENGMPITNDDLDSFYQFELVAIKTDNSRRSLHQLVEQWDAQRERADVNKAIRQGHAEIEAGGGKPYEEFAAEMKSKYDLKLER